MHEAFTVGSVESRQDLTHDSVRLTSFQRSSFEQLSQAEATNSFHNNIGPLCGGGRIKNRRTHVKNMHNVLVDQISQQSGAQTKTAVDDTLSREFLVEHPNSNFPIEHRVFGLENL